VCIFFLCFFKFLVFEAAVYANKGVYVFSCCSGSDSVRAGRQTAGAVSAAATRASSPKRHRVSPGLAGHRPPLPGAPPAPLGLRAVEPRPAAPGPPPGPHQPLRHQRAAEGFPRWCRETWTAAAGCRSEVPLRRRSTASKLERSRLSVRLADLFTCLFLPSVL